MPSVKIVIAGPSDTHTTFIGSVSEIPVLSTERRAAGSSAAAEPQITTVDFGRLSVEGCTVSLFGTPAASRITAAWESVCDGMLGMIVIVNGTERASVQEGTALLEYLQRIARFPVAVGAHRIEPDDTFSLDRIRRDMHLAPETPLVALDVRERRSVAEALGCLLEHAAQFASEPVSRDARV